jgi:hypothetical protein
MAYGTYYCASRRLTASQVGWSFVSGERQRDSGTASGGGGEGVRRQRRRRLESSIVLEADRYLTLVRRELEEPATSNGNLTVVFVKVFGSELFLHIFPFRRVFLFHSFLHERPVTKRLCPRGRTHAAENYPRKWVNVRLSKQVSFQIKSHSF